MRKIIFALGMAFFTQAVMADALSALKHFNENVTALSGGFSQTVINKKKTQKSSGSFSILRPGYFKWTYDKPFKQVIVGDSKNIYLYDEDLAQVLKRTQNRVLGDSPAAILANKGVLEEKYTLKSDGQEGEIQFVLAEPKNQDSEFNYIRLGFNANTLQRMQLQDSFGNKTDIVFKSLNTKSKVRPQDFKFVIPKGVDVLEE